MLTWLSQYELVPPTSVDLAELIQRACEDGNGEVVNWLLKQATFSQEPVETEVANFGV